MILTEPFLKAISGGSFELINVKRELVKAHIENHSLKGRNKFLREHNDKLIVEKQQLETALKVSKLREK